MAFIVVVGSLLAVASLGGEARCVGSVPTTPCGWGALSRVTDIDRGHTDGCADRPRQDGVAEMTLAVDSRLRLDEGVTAPLVFARRKIECGVDVYLSPVTTLIDR